MLAHGLGHVIWVESINVNHFSAKVQQPVKTLKGVEKTPRMSQNVWKILLLALNISNVCLYAVGMDSDQASRMNVLVERLRSIDKSITRLTAERLKVLAEIAKLDAEDGASERQTASRVARITSSTPKQASGEVAMAKQVAALPGIAEAHAKGEISNNQLGAVAAIASASSEGEALELAKTGTSAQLHRRAAASRGKLFEERRKAQTGRYLAFKPEEDGQSTRIHGRLPFAESKHLEATSKDR
jgi:chorismate mutase